MNNNYNNNALTSREIGMMVVFVLAVAAVLYIAIKGMREEARKKSNYEIQGAGVKKSDNAKWIPLSIIGVGIVATVAVVAISSRTNKRLKN